MKPDESQLNYMKPMKMKKVKKKKISKRKSKNTSLAQRIFGK